MGCNDYEYSIAPVEEYTKWGYRSITFVEKLIECPECFAAVSNREYNDKRIPWREHVLWHKKIQDDDGFTFGWQWPHLRIEDKAELWAALERMDAYREVRVS